MPRPLGNRFYFLCVFNPADKEKCTRGHISELHLIFTDFCRKTNHNLAYRHCLASVGWTESIWALTSSVILIITSRWRMISFFSRPFAVERLFASKLIEKLDISECCGGTTYLYVKVQQFVSCAVRRPAWVRSTVHHHHQCVFVFVSVSDSCGFTHFPHQVRKSILDTSYLLTILQLDEKIDMNWIAMISMRNVWFFWVLNNLFLSMM